MWTYYAKESIFTGYGPRRFEHTEMYGKRAFKEDLEWSDYIRQSPLDDLIDRKLQLLEDQKE